MVARGPPGCHRPSPFRAVRGDDEEVSLPDGIVLRRLDPALRARFFDLQAACGGWCMCVAWWVPTWEGWGDRTAAQNRAAREELFAAGHDDGYLALVPDGRAIGWVQVGPRDRLEKLRRTFALAPDPAAWAISCFQVDPAFRSRGVARWMLGQLLVDLRARGVARVEAYPRRDEPAVFDPGEVWTGPASLFEQAGFVDVGGDARRRVVGLDLA